jgi:hypothetical protein
MRTKTVDLLMKIYDREPGTDIFIVKLSIDRYTDIFNGLDPSPLRHRDLAPSVISYLDDCSSDIPLKYKLDIQVICPKEIMNEGRENRTMNGLRTYFNYMLLLLKKDRHMLRKKSVVYFFTSIVLLFLSLYLGSILPGDIFFRTAIEGLSIGGWVFLWEAIVLAFFKSRKLRTKSKRYRRLANAPITFTYQDIG